MIYTFTQWLFFFYFYCFLGWIWETCYVSVLKGHWVNRGFMRGPFLPIYGSGAIIVLIFTLPYRTNAVAVFFMGMISATILEYITGVVMEKLFHVRYWDYSNQKLNINGHICLTSSLAWGVFSILLTMHGHKPVERMVEGFNSNALEVVCFLLTVYISIDMAESIREALNLKELLLSLEENNAEFRKLQKHMEVLSAFYGTEIKERSEEGLKKLNAVVEAGKEKYAKYGNSGKKQIVFSLKNKEFNRMSELLKRNPAAVSKMHEQAFQKLKELTRKDDDKETSQE